MALIGTSTGNVYVVNSVGQLEKILVCSEEEVMSITSDDDYIAVHCYDGFTTVWLKEGYIKWWTINMVCYSFLDCIALNIIYSPSGEIC